MKPTEEKSQDIPPAHKQTHKKNFITANKQKAKIAPARVSVIKPSSDKQPEKTPQSLKPSSNNVIEERKDPKQFKEDIVSKMNNLMTFLQDHCESDPAFAEKFQKLGFWIKNINDL